MLETLALLLPICVASVESAVLVSADVEVAEGGSASTLACGFCAGVLFGLAGVVALCAAGN
jgi:hypothetical protein